MAGMPQLKLGWVVINGPGELVETARGRLELLLDTYLSVNTPTQCALGELFEVGEQIRTKLLGRIRQNLDFLKNELEGSGIHLLRTEGGWSAILQLPRVMPEETWVERLLREYNVIVQPGYFFDMPSEAYIVVSLITDAQILEEGIRRLRLLLAHP
jgi:alanine-synthesizing transaminase